MPLHGICQRLILQLAEARVNRVTITGGEPFMHADLIPIVAAFRDAGMGVGVCTNATMVTDEQITALAELDAHMNVSLDGFSPESHGRFRGGDSQAVRPRGHPARAAVHPEQPRRGPGVRRVVRVRPGPGHQVRADEPARRDGPRREQLPHAASAGRLHAAQPGPDDAVRG
ncbi:radical SAM protein [Streptomyces sp. NPDC021218]|uniref:radical SAM protein n=1 Tax=Streptomyces sp. NPDC021218 TaxID=3365119 RepID=UPI00379CDB7D